MSGAPSRADRIREIERAVGERTIVWFAGRGAESEALLALRQYREAYAYTAALGSPRLDIDFTMELLTGERADHRIYAVDRDRPDAVRQLRDHLRASFQKPTLLVSVKPSAFLASTYIPYQSQVQYAGLFHEHQRALEHKPWVETELRRAGVPTVPWTYVAAADLERVDAGRDGRSIVLRASRSDAGAGFALVRPGDDLAAAWPDATDGYVSVAPYLEGAIPICVNAVLFRGGAVSIHPASVQLIGIRALTNGVFGFAGNDFARIRDLDDETLDTIDGAVRGAGAWLGRHGYVGAFGVDLLVHEGRVHVAEINPRYQASSPLASRLDAALDRSDMHLEHIAAHLGLAPEPATPLRAVVRAQAGPAQLMAYNTQTLPRRLAASDEPVAKRWSFEPELLPPPGVRVLPDAVLARLVLEGPVTTDGLSLRAGLEAEVEAYLDSRFEPVGGHVAGPAAV